MARAISKPLRPRQYVFEVAARQQRPLIARRIRAVRATEENAASAAALARVDRVRSAAQALRRRRESCGELAELREEEKAILKEREALLEMLGKAALAEEGEGVVGR